MGVPFYLKRNEPKIIVPPPTRDSVCFSLRKTILDRAVPKLETADAKVITSLTAVNEATVMATVAATVTVSEQATTSDVIIKNATMLSETPLKPGQHGRVAGRPQSRLAIWTLPHAVHERDVGSLSATLKNSITVTVTIKAMYLAL